MKHPAENEAWLVNEMESTGDREGFDENKYKRGSSLKDGEKHRESSVVSES